MLCEVDHLLLTLLIPDWLSFDVNMGSSCSSAQKKRKTKSDKMHTWRASDNILAMTLKMAQYTTGHQLMVVRALTDSLPYGKGSPPSSRRPSFDPNSAPATVPEQAEAPPSPLSGIRNTCDKDAPSLDAIGLPDLQRFPDHVRSLILGRINGYSAEKGYELNVTDLHWGIAGVGLVDHSLPELCMNTLEKWRTRRRLLTLVIFNDNIGPTLLPRTLPKPHFESGMESVETDDDKELFKKWYILDSVASPYGICSSASYQKLPL
ncbi:NACHT and WD repeat domain-containing protein 2 [Caerostris extrusa]|uniref:NACHT and WD repeat domain-containing protein 2 n=1 Tax=Caerostris extrusa TaxID=172846 RepID=A0AAV4MUW4_CAEEX|nr:NACHT and WD repeat domain-containing protein 2 [Caerostris extrusa]